MSHTIIPDIQEDFYRLEWSIEQAHFGNQLVFLGDLIDAGKTVKIPTDLKVLQHLRDLTDKGKALSILGNHELNAILFHRNYALTGKPQLQSNRATSLDFPAMPCVYNWQGEENLNPDHLRIQALHEELER